MLNFELEPAGGPFHDPALLVSPQNARTSLLFDCGTLHGLKTKDLLRVRWVFLSHHHIDHLIGFDHLLRVRLFSDLPLTVVGPLGTTAVIGHRLQGYSWNLTSGSPFCVEAVDLHQQSIVDSRLYRCHHQFHGETPPTPAKVLEPGCFSLEDDLILSWHPVDHGVPCCCYRLERRFTPKFSLERCQSLGLKPGPWVKALTAKEEFTLEVQGQTRDAAWLREQLLSEVPSQSLGFLTDTRLSPTLSKELCEFFRGVDVLVSECAYLNADSKLAEDNLHMTCSQVASLATAADVGALKLFHLSRRYQEQGPQEHLRETRSVFENTGLLSE